MFIAKTFGKEKIAQEEFCQIYLLLFSYCNSDEDEETLISGKEIYTVIQETFRKELKKHHYENLYSTAKLFRKLQEIEAFCYSMFRHIDRFYVKFAGVKNTNELLHELIYELYIDKNISVLNEDILKGLSQLRKHTNEKINDPNYDVEQSRKVLKIVTTFYVENCVKNEQSKAVLELRNKIVQGFMEYKDKNIKTRDMEKLMRFLTKELENYQAIFDPFMCKLMIENISVDDNSLKNMITTAFDTDKCGDIYNVVKYMKSGYMDLFTEYCLKFIKQKYFDKEHLLLNRNSNSLKDNETTHFITFYFDTMEFLNKHKIVLNQKVLETAMKECFMHDGGENTEFKEICDFIKSNLISSQYNFMSLIGLIKIFTPYESFAEKLYEVIEKMLFVMVNLENPRNMEFLNKIGEMVKNMESVHIKTKLLTLIRTFMEYLDKKTKIIDIYRGLTSVEDCEMTRNKEIVSTTKCNVFNYSVLRKRHATGTVNNMLTGVVINFNKYRMRVNLVTLNILLFLKEFKHLSFDELMEKTNIKKDMLEFYMKILIDRNVVLFEKGMFKLNGSYVATEEFTDMYVLTENTIPLEQEKVEGSMLEYVLQAFIMRHMKKEKTQERSKVIKETKNKHADATEEMIEKNIQSLLDKNFLKEEDSKITYVA